MHEKESPDSTQELSVDRVSLVVPNDHLYITSVENGLKHHGNGPKKSQRDKSLGSSNTAGLSIVESLGFRLRKILYKCTCI